MLEKFKAMLGAAVGSKKAAATVAAIVMRIFGTKWGLDAGAVESIVYSIMAYVIGQGIADHGKEAVKAKEAA